MQQEKEKRESIWRYNWKQGNNCSHLIFFAWGTKIWKRTKTFLIIIIKTDNDGLWRAHTFIKANHFRVRLLSQSLWCSYSSYSFNYDLCLTKIMGWQKFNKHSVQALFPARINKTLYRCIFPKRPCLHQTRPARLTFHPSFCWSARNSDH